MNKLNIPWTYSKNLFEIPVEFFKRLNIEVLLVDLDNTLDSHANPLPSGQVIHFKDILKTNGIKIVILSNNKGPRVKKYAEALGVDYLSHTGKPGIKKANKYLNEHNVDKTKALYCGDQVINDIRFANKLGVKTILVDPLVQSDQFVTKIVRIWDKPLRNKLVKKNLLVSWRKRYESN